MGYVDDATHGARHTRPDTASPTARTLTRGRWARRGGLPPVSAMITAGSNMLQLGDNGAAPKRASIRETNDEPAHLLVVPEEFPAGRDGERAACAGHVGLDPRVLRAMCVHQCPIRQKCLDWAIANNERGIWGGTDERERNRIRLQRGA
ncbi:MAG TPA: WhiB family transcriptional regulator [Actinomycetota bacterium]|nr:WhiB family transcriptional regulator [Actinomycetota bacterium]